MRKWKKWKNRAKLAEDLAEKERGERTKLQGFLLRLSRAVADRGVADLGITFEGWVDHATRLLREASRPELREAVLSIVESEPELPGPAPPQITEEQVELLRATVRATKQAITRRIVEHFDRAGP